jgi:hypothetical protein
MSEAAACCTLCGFHFKPPTFDFFGRFFLKNPDTQLWAQAQLAQAQLAQAQLAQSALAQSAMAHRAKRSATALGAAILPPGKIL